MRGDMDTFWYLSRAVTSALLLLDEGKCPLSPSVLVAALWKLDLLIQKFAAFILQYRI